MRKAAASAAFLIQFHYVKYTKRRETQLHVWEKFDLVWMVDCGRVLHRFGGLTTNQSQRISLSAISGGRVGATASSRPSGARTGHPARLRPRAGTRVFNKWFCTFAKTLAVMS